MQQERGRRTHKLFPLSARKIFWLTILSVSVLLFPVEFLLLVLFGRSGGSDLPSNPWFVITLISCFIGGAISAFIILTRLMSRKVSDFMARGSGSGLVTGLLHVSLWLVLFLSLVIYASILPIPQPSGRLMSGYGLNSLVLAYLLVFFLIASFFYVIAACIGGLLIGLIKGCIVRFAKTEQQ